MTAEILTMEQGTIVRWLAQAGDRVEAGQEILEVETDKAVVAVEAHDSEKPLEGDSGVSRVALQGPALGDDVATGPFGHRRGLTFAIGSARVHSHALLQGSHLSRMGCEDGGGGTAWQRRCGQLVSRAPRQQYGEQTL